ncbi:hypothetical protein JK358_08800 [Nocardia sp. 2]|uniref:DUF4905 domain-containing protein n=1 Tax=Nocardia acididurans TaxID=2802282 RepID=A0ABS1M2T7_9NOCA|nr:hypothetical protein [Nocardia acididurans]MBL1074494.1 hypothetical protein [Nocardia acididurans]
MGLGSLWRRGLTGSAEAADERWLAVESTAWQVFSEELALQLFMLPVEGCVCLSLRDREVVRFERGGAALTWVLDPDRADQGAVRRQRLPWPARYQEYLRVGDYVARELRSRFEVWLPAQFIARAWIDDTGEVLSTGGLGHDADAAAIRAAGPEEIADAVEMSRLGLDARRQGAEAEHQLRMICGNNLFQHRGLEILTGSDMTWPVRDRTVDFIGLEGPDTLLVVDVFPNLDDLEEIPLVRREVDGGLVEQGDPAYIWSMIHADPDFRAVLEQRPHLAEALAQGRMRVDYTLIVMDSDKSLRYYEFEPVFGPPETTAAVDISYEPSAAAPQSPQPPAGDAEPIELQLPFDPYPLLQPADWPHRHLIPHWPSASGNAPLIVLTADMGDGYAMQSYDPDAPGNDFLLPAAIARLSGLQRYPWETDELYGLPTVNCSGHDFSAEKVLDPRAMQGAHDALDSTRLWVSTPRRTCLLAVPYELDERQLMVFQRLVTLTYEDDSYGNAPITLGVFLLENGRIIDFVEDVNLLGAH